jgi:hypothetical protein
MNAEQCRARAEAYESCAGHLELDWTDDPAERYQGDRLKLIFYRAAERLRESAAYAERGRDPRRLNPEA